MRLFSKMNIAAGLVVASTTMASAQGVSYEKDYTNNDPRFHALMDRELQKACPNPAPRQSDPTLQQCWKEVVYSAFQLANDYSNAIANSTTARQLLTQREQSLLGECESKAQEAYDAPFNRRRPETFTAPAADAAIFCIEARDEVAKTLGERNSVARNYVVYQLDCIASTVDPSIPCRRPRGM